MWVVGDVVKIKHACVDTEAMRQFVVHCLDMLLIMHALMPTTIIVRLLLLTKVRLL